jgi:hypothetical protein
MGVMCDNEWSSRLDDGRVLLVAVAVGQTIRVVIVAKRGKDLGAGDPVWNCLPASAAPAHPI